MNPRLNTGKVIIGFAYIPPPQPIRSMDAWKIQTALLDKRTAHPCSPLRRMIAPVMRWL